MGWSIWTRSVGGWEIAACGASDFILHCFTKGVDFVKEAEREVLLHFAVEKEKCSKA